MKVVEAVGLRTLPKASEAGVVGTPTFTGRGQVATCGDANRRDFLQVVAGAIGFSFPHYGRRVAGAVKPADADRSCIMIFNLGPLATRPLRHEAECARRNPRSVQADR